MVVARAAEPGAGALAGGLAVARRRLWGGRALRRAAWAAAGAVLAAEGAFVVALAAGALDGPDRLRVALGVGAGVAVLGAAGAAAADRPTPAEAAGALDLALGTGALVTTAAEAAAQAPAAGAPAGLGAVVVARAGARLAGADLGQALPLRAPGGPLALLAAAALFGAWLPAVARGVAPPGPAGPRTLALAGPLEGGAGGDAGAGDTAGVDDLAGAAALAVGEVEGPAPAPEHDPLAALPPEVAAVLRERAAGAAAALPADPGADGADGADGPPPGGEDAAALAGALARGDVAGALGALDALEARAEAGDAGARAALRALAGRLAGGGVGGAGGAGGLADPDAADARPGAGATAPGVPGRSVDRGRRGRLPWALEQASRRYFATTTTTAAAPRETGRSP